MSWSATLERTFSPGSSFGAIVDRRRVADCTLSESRYPAGHSTPRHAHEQAYFYTVLRGGYSEAFGSTTLHPKPFGLVFHPAGHTHSHRTEAPSGAACFNLDLGPEWHIRLGDQAAILDRPTHFEDVVSAPLATRLYQEFRATDAASPLAIEALVLEILSIAARRQAAGEMPSRPPRWLEEARDLLHAHFRDDLSVNEVALAVGVHPVHLARTFRRQYQVTMGDYVRRLRVEFAADQIARGDLSLAELAAEAGFADQSHFSRTFRSLRGVSPGEFRRELTKRPPRMR